MPTPSAQTLRLSPRTIGLAAAVITVLIWTSFILIARASADPARGGLLTPLDIAYCRIVGAALILLPWGAYLVHRDRADGLTGASWLGLSPLPRHVTVSVGFFGGLLYALLAYSGFAYAPALHASVLMPGSLPLWTALLAAWLLRDHITPGHVVGLGLIVLGDLLVGGLSLLRAFDGGQVWLGDLLFMSAALCWATYGVLALTGMVQAHVFTAPLSEVLFQALFQGWGSVVISGITFTQMIRYFGPVRTTMITALVPGLSAIGAVLFLSEPLHWNLVAGLMLVTAGILFGVRASGLTSAPSKATHLLQPCAGS